MLKLYLSKDLDKVNWLFLRLILTQVGIPPIFIDWIEACYSDVSYVVLINGYPTSFLNPSHGLHQECTLSPLLFLLVA